MGAGGPLADGSSQSAEIHALRAAYEALHAKYGWQMTVVDFFSRLTGRIGARAIVELEPAT